MTVAYSNGGLERYACAPGISSGSCGVPAAKIEAVGRAISYLRDKGEIAILLVEQYFDFAQELADRFAILDRGHVVASGTQAHMMDKDVRAHLTV